MDSAPLPPQTPPARVKRPYIPAVGPRLRILLWVVFALVGILGVNSAYLLGVTLSEWSSGAVYQNYFYQLMFLLHLGLGLLLVLPFVLFAGFHVRATFRRKNRRAVRIGYALLGASILVLVSGILLTRIGGFDLKNPMLRGVMYWTHLAAPAFVLWLYWLHRLAGPPIRWRVGLAYAAGVAAVAVGMVMLHAQDPRQWHVVGPAEGEKYFEPSLARTATGDFIPAETLMMDQYCQKCHADVYDGWFHSVHHISSFNNPAYLASVRETREVALKRDGNVRASRWCAGCHDPVPFFSGAFDNPHFDDVKDPTSQAGITCTTCHAITHVNSTRGNADYTIEEPIHYPFANSDNAVLQFLNNQLVKAKPRFHKQTFLKPFHKTAEFCSVCHKVSLPGELTHYKEWLRGQNHYDPYLLSGVSGHGARSFYYPPKAEENCNGCHMPLVASDDFGAQFFAGADKLSIHNHLFPAANTAIPFLRNQPSVVAAHQDFLKGVMRVDIFGVKEGGSIDDPLTAPIRPQIPTLLPGKDYLFETVVRTLKMGHLFTQGTVDSNEVWLEVTVTSGGEVIGKSGGMDAKNAVDPWSHFINVYMLDRNGNRIDRRNPQDIFVPLYNHQIPPGAGQVVHYALRLPDQVTQPVTVEVKLQYRKFDATYMDFIARTHRPTDHPIKVDRPDQTRIDDLPITTLAVDRVTFPVAGFAGAVAESLPPAEPLWQRWNDYGIGLLLEGMPAGGRAELRQAAEAFAEVEKLGRFDGPLNLARVYYSEGRLDDAAAALSRAAAFTDPPPYPWTMAWMSGLINKQQGRLDEAIANFRSVLEDYTAEHYQRGFDFSKDYEVIDQLGMALFERAKQCRGPQNAAQRKQFLQQAVEQFHKTLALDSEDVTAHYNLSLLYEQLDQPKLAEEHRELHARYKGDDNARDRAIALARAANPAADHAAEKVVRYPLQRPGAPGLSTRLTPPAPPADIQRGGE